MNRYRSRTTQILLVVMMVLGLINKFNHTACHFRHLAVHRRPSIVLKLGDLDGVLHFAIGHIEFPSRVIRPDITLHVLDQNVIVLYLVVRPIPRTLFRPIANLRYHDNRIDALFGYHAPEIGNRFVQRILRDDKRFGIVVAFDERCVYVCGVFATGYRIQNHSISIEWYHKFAAIFATMLFVVASRTGFVGLVGNGFNFLNRKKSGKN